MHLSRLREIDPLFLEKSLDSGSSAAEAPHARLLTEEDFQIMFGVEIFRCTVYNTNFIGIAQTGLDEMIGIAIRRLPLKGRELEESLTNSILLNGGSCLVPGERLEDGVRMTRPCGTPIQIFRMSDPILDA